MKKRKSFLRILGVLLFSVLMLLPASVAFSPSKILASMTTDPGGVAEISCPSVRDGAWDNGGIDGFQVGLSSQLDVVYPFNSQVADDFRFNGTTAIAGVHWWGVFYAPAEGVNPADFNIIFYADAGGMPTGSGMDDPTATALAVFFLPQVIGAPTGGTAEYEYEVELPGVFVAMPDTVYWIAIQWVGQFPPQWGWDTNGHNPEHYSPAMHGFPDIGYPYWEDAGFGDMAFSLSAHCSDDRIPPVTTCTITGEYEKTVTLNATDDYTGVSSTFYLLDDGEWINYTAPFIVPDPGDHYLSFYSVDYAGNTEAVKNETFTVESPPLSITISGGFGVSATIKNNGAVAVTDVDWLITLDGTLIFYGRTKSGTIDSLAAGAEFIVKDFVVGFGKTGITLNAGDRVASASGIAFLIFISSVT